MEATHAVCMWYAKWQMVTGLEKDRLLRCMGQVLQQGVDRIGEVGDRTSKGQDAGLCGTGFTGGSLEMQACG